VSPLGVFPCRLGVMPCGLPSAQVQEKKQLAAEFSELQLEYSAVKMNFVQTKKISEEVGPSHICTGTGLTCHTCTGTWSSRRRSINHMSNTGTHTCTSAERNSAQVWHVHTQACTE